MSQESKRAMELKSEINSLEMEINRLRQRISSLSQSLNQLTDFRATRHEITTDTLIEMARTKFADEALAEIHVVRQEQHVWTALNGYSKIGMNRFTIEGAKIRRSFVGSSLDNCLKQLYGTALPDINEWLQADSIA